MIGLTLQEQVADGWTALFGLVREPSGRLRPRSQHFHELAWLEEGKGSLSLHMVREGLDHPTTGPELSLLRWRFLLANLGEAKEDLLSQWLSGPAKDPFKSKQLCLDLSLTEDTVVYTLTRARGKFWPF